VSAIAKSALQRFSSDRWAMMGASIGFYSALSRADLADRTPDRRLVLRQRRCARTLFRPDTTTARQRRRQSNAGRHRTRASFGRQRRGSGVFIVLLVRASATPCSAVRPSV
jgi:hypothetical protein